MLIADLSSTREEAWRIFEEERWEALESVLEALEGRDLDGDGAAACDNLLRHLSGLAPRGGKPRIN